MGWNTETVITEALKGAESAGAVAERFDLFRQKQFSKIIKMMYD